MAFKPSHQETGSAGGRPDLLADVEQYEERRRATLEMARDVGQDLRPADRVSIVVSAKTSASMLVSVQTIHLLFRELVNLPFRLSAF